MKSAPVRYSKGGVRADTRKLDAAQKATEAQLAALSARIDEQFGSARGSLLMRGAFLWAPLVPGTSGHFLKSNGAGADLAFAEVPAPRWTLIETRAVNGNEDFTDLGSYSEVFVVLNGVTASSSGIRAAGVSIDNGASFLAVGDYIAFAGDGVAGLPERISLHATQSSLSRYSFLHIKGFNLTGAPKLATTITTTTFLIPTTSALNAVRIGNTNGTPNGGTIYVYAKT